MNINELNDFPPMDDNWSNEKKEEYNRLIKLANISDKVLRNITEWANDPDTLRKRDEFLRTYPKKDI